MKLLHIDSSILGANSVTRVLTADTVAAWRAAHPQTQVDYLDLAADTPEHFAADALGVKIGVQGEPSAAQRRQNEISERLLSQFLAADVIVLGVPLYNFSVPSQLKAWIDRLAQPGRTFQYTSAGPVGLAGGKTVIVVSSRGGKYPEAPPAGVLVPQERDYLRLMFGFMGITDVRLVSADGVAMGEEARSQAMAEARAQIAALVTPAEAAA